jgi:glycosyltransferase involved in cell wall biosynthesis
MPSIIVFSHLRWDFVFQRPQHLLSRLAQYYSIVFIEEPVFDEKGAYWEVYNPLDNVTVCKPHTSVAMPGFHDDQLPQLRKLLREVVEDHVDHVVWFYTPMALPLLQEIQPQLVVYDCMDELAAFKNAPKQLLQRESALLKLADVVFTGGPSLYRAKQERHHNVHCFSSSVDVKHFRQALDSSISFQGQKDIPSPRLGFYGVIDERFDTGLLADIADARPQWQFVLVGPVVKIDPATLPQRANIHYFGQRSYEVLPQFLAGWDVCLLPFALNESTQFISPTKTLEYMAAELPIVSTPVTDVADIYSGIVYIASDAQQFIKACEAALHEDEGQRMQRIEKMRAVVASTSWDETATRMYELMEKAKKMRDSASPSTSLKQGQTEEVGQIAEINVLHTAPIPHARPIAADAGQAGPRRSLSS